MISANDLRKIIQPELQEEINYIEKRIVEQHNKTSPADKYVAMSFKNVDLTIPQKLVIMDYIKAHGYDLRYNQYNLPFTHFIVFW